MKLVVGLGNPGKEYERTRHNVGFLVLDKFLGDVIWKEKFNSFYCIIDDVCYVKPLTYMNESGKSVSAFQKYYKVGLDDILVIQDDLDMKFGTFKLKINSSDGGHNGIKSIIQCLGSNKFARLKIGILDDTKENAVDFVLGKFSKNDLEAILNNENFDKIIKMFINLGISETLNSYRG